MQETITTDSPFIEVRYSTAKGLATPRYHPYEEELLERKLISLRRRHIEAEVVNLLTGEAVGGVEPGDGINPWTWWYSPEGIDAREAPARSQKIVCALSAR